MKIDEIQIDGQRVAEALRKLNAAYQNHKGVDIWCCVENEKVQFTAFVRLPGVSENRTADDPITAAEVVIAHFDPIITGKRKLAEMELQIEQLRKSLAPVVDVEGVRA